MNRSHHYFLQTERLGFRTWTEADIDLAIDLWGDINVTQLIDARGPLSDDQVCHRLRQEIVTAATHGIQYWPIFRLADTVHVGCCGLRPHDVPKHLFELGFHLCSTHWGQGYAAEAARAVIGFAFGALGAAGLFAGHHPANCTSRHLLTKLGFHYTHDVFYPPTGLQHPSYQLMHTDSAAYVKS